MHPYDTVLTPSLLATIREGVAHSPAATAMVDMCMASPSPGGMLASVLRVHGLGDYLHTMLEKVLPTPKLHHKDVFAEVSQDDINKAYKAVMDRYAILGSKKCIEEMYALGFTCGYLYGLLIADYPVETISDRAMAIYKHNILSSELLAEAKLITGEVQTAILKISTTLRSVAKEGPDPSKPPT